DDGVVLEDAVADAADRAREPAEHQACLLVGVEHVVAHDDVPRLDAGVLRADLEAEVAFGDDVVLDDEVPGAVHVDPAGEAAAVARPRALDAVLAADAVARDLGLVRLDVALAADEVYADVVDVADDVARDREAVDVAVQRERFARRGLTVVDHVAVDHQIRDRRGPRAEDGDAHGVRAADVVDVVVAELDVRTRAHDADARAVVHAEEVPDFEADHPDPAPVLDVDHVVAGDARAVEDRALAGERRERDEPADGVAAPREDDLLGVRRRRLADDHRVAGDGDVEGALDGREVAARRR